MPVKKTTLVLLAAGRATRFGDVKQLVPVGPAGEALMDYTVYDAATVGFSGIVLITSSALQQPISDHALSTYGSFPAEVAVQDPETDAERGLWGTGHAVLAAAGALDGPFAVCNADDYYGRAALAAVHQHLITTDGGDPPVHCVAGYRLDATLSSTGGVSRAVCNMADGYVTDVSEVHHAIATGDGVTGELVDGTPVHYRGDEAVSMNLWGFHDAVLEVLQEQFEVHRGTGPVPPSEFYLSDAMGEQLRTGAARLKCLPCPNDWFGMTYADDLAGVRARMAQQISDGRYPSALAGRFTPAP